MEVISKKPNGEPIYLYEEDEIKQTFKNNLELQRIIFKMLFSSSPQLLSAVKTLRDELQCGLKQAKEFTDYLRTTDGWRDNMFLLYQQEYDVDFC